MAGLLPALKVKVADVDGKFDDFIIKAQYGDVKQHELNVMSAPNPLGLGLVAEDKPSELSWRCLA